VTQPVASCDRYKDLPQFLLPSLVQHQESLGLFGLIVHGTAHLPVYSVEGCAGGHGAWVGAGLARVGVHVCAKVGMVEIGCGGYLGGTPPIGKLEPLGLISGEKVLQDGWQGRCRW